MLLLYIGCAFAIPTARTVTQRLEMEGSEITPETIWQKVTEESAYIARTTTDTINNFGQRINTGLANDATQMTENGSAAQKPVAKKKRMNVFLYIITSVLLLAMLAFGLHWIISNVHFDYPLSTDLYNIFRNPVASLTGMRILVVTTIIIIILLLLIGFLVLIFLPVAFILRSNSSPTWKVIGLIVWAIVIWFIYH